MSFGIAGEVVQIRCSDDLERVKVGQLVGGAIKGIGYEEAVGALQEVMDEFGDGHCYLALLKKSVRGEYVDIGASAVVSDITSRLNLNHLLPDQVLKWFKVVEKAEDVYHLIPGGRGDGMSIFSFLEAYHKSVVYGRGIEVRRDFRPITKGARLGVALVPMAGHAEHHAVIAEIGSVALGDTHSCDHPGTDYSPCKHCGKMNATPRYVARDGKEENLLVERFCDVVTVAVKDREKPMRSSDIVRQLREPGYGDRRGLDVVVFSSDKPVEGRYHMPDRSITIALPISCVGEGKGETSCVAYAASVYVPLGAYATFMHGDDAGCIVNPKHVPVQVMQRGGFRVIFDVGWEKNFPSKHVLVRVEHDKVGYERFLRSLYLNRYSGFGNLVEEYTSKPLAIYVPCRYWQVEDPGKFLYLQTSAGHVHCVGVKKKNLHLTIGYTESNREEGSIIGGVGVIGEDPRGVSLTGLTLNEDEDDWDSSSDYIDDAEPEGDDHSGVYRHAVIDKGGMIQADIVGTIVRCVSGKFKAGPVIVGVEGGNVAVHQGCFKLSVYGEAEVITCCDDYAIDDGGPEFDEFEYPKF